MRVLPVLSAFIIVLLCTVTLGRRRRKANLVHLINESDRNLRLHCQSILTDLHDLFLDNGANFKWNFYDIDQDNMHFWCDAYGLNDFFEQFDVFGEMAPSQLNNTCRYSRVVNVLRYLKDSETRRSLLAPRSVSPTYFRVGHFSNPNRLLTNTITNLCDDNTFCKRICTIANGMN
ncbi:hypothetical protein L596_000890 [Steinernema carpocapsae]|uniref:Uncharacterized protein n=1 Tax=Steinernema carpocapsae TaxID=34508 RepID=A0A4U8UJQ9_STECR|nr:hypothetical protein L596_000890 [Steinernema carpocapsae]